MDLIDVTLPDAPDLMGMYITDEEVKSQIAISFTDRKSTSYSDVCNISI